MDSILKAKKYVAERGGATNIKLTEDLKLKLNKTIYKHHSKENKH